jgi:hypothetical protein
MEKKKLKFLLFLGVFFFLYLVLYFPKDGETIIFSQIAFDVARSIVMSFVIIYVSVWFMKLIDSRLKKSG